MANEENLRPFEKGESGNPNGRPKGSRNRSTIIRELLEALFNGKDPLTGEERQDNYESVISRSMIKKAMDGDVSAYNAIMDSAYGKARQTVEQTNVNHEGVKVTIVRDKDE